MNLKGFKKIQEDEDRATLQNQRGHSITLAKKQLSKNHVSALEKLPLYKADGGGVEGALANNDAALEQIDQSEQQPQEQVAPATPQAIKTPAPMAPKPVAQPQPMQPEQVAMAHKAEADQEAANHWQDLLQGHIKPETYHSLFAKKSTPGKIGTLFGLLISGAGSGLTHQPNAVLDMMNKEIDRDLEAQKSASAGAQNYYRLNQQNELNKANLGKITAETAGLNKDVEFKAQNNAKNGMMLGATHKLLTDLNLLPEGPVKERAKQTFMGVQQAVGSEIQQNNNRLGMNLVTDPEAEFQRKQQGLRAGGNLGILPGAEGVAKANDERHVPGVGNSSLPVPDHVRTELVAHKKLEDAAKDLFAFTKKHTTMIPGTPEYNTGEEKAEVLRQMVREGMLGTVFRESEKPLLEKFVPKNPGGFLKVLQAQPKLRALIESNVMAGNALREAYGLPKVGHSESKEGGALMTKSGKPYIIKDGKPVYK